jgi:CRISPR-associated protein (TIGR02710 family)
MYKKAMIVSVGGTVEPVVTSLLKHRPDYVCFFASQQSLDTIGDIKKQAKEKGLTFQDYKVVCDDVNDLVHCYGRALQCASKLPGTLSEHTDVTVDYTGGTKTMTAALALATVGHGYSFSYVGGGERTKNGLGVVVSGHEVVKTGVSPWQIFAVEEKKRISLFASTFQFEAAISTMERTMSKLGEPEQQVWTGMIEVLTGFLNWDNFDHVSAVKHLAAGIKQMDLCSKFQIEGSIKGYMDKVRGCFSSLQEMSMASSFFKKLHPLIVRDLVANARRRYLQSKYDDAVARLYRALEMVGQIEFEKETGCSTSDAAPYKLPERLREEYARLYGSGHDGKLKIPLFPTFRVLREINSPVGQKFEQNKDDLRNLLNARNGSILAHGVVPIARKTYEQFEKVILDLFVDKPLIEFPSLRW